MKLILHMFNRNIFICALQTIRISEEKAILKK